MMSSFDTSTNTYAEEARMSIGAAAFNVNTMNSIPIHFGANRSSNSANAMSVNTDNNVTVHTSFFNNSDSKLKDDQRTADHAAIQAVFDAIDVTKYTRNDLNQQRIGLIADDFFAALPPEFRCLVSEHTYNQDTIKQLDYSRACCLLCGVCKTLQGRVTQLEQAVSSSRSSASSA